MANSKELKLVNEIKDLLETVRIYINNDGGDIEFISFKDKILTLKILGACVGCPFINVTFDQGVKQIFLNEFKGKIKDVIFI